MKISQELEDKLVGVAVVKGSWHDAFLWLRDSGLPSMKEPGKAGGIVDAIARKHRDISVPIFGSMLSRMKYLDDRD